MTAIAEPRLSTTLVVSPPAIYRTPAAAPPRTLVDVLAATASAFPHADALDDGTTVLTYRELAVEVDALRRALVAKGVGLGDRVGVRVPSGTVDLYVAILATLAAGAAYVPVDADDPQERADLVFGEAAVAAVIGEHRAIERRGPALGIAGRPTPDDDAWIIFTSGSTGTPKGVAVTHRAAAAFVDAEAELFLQDDDVEPLGPDDRVLAGLSVAFDASCEEMWLAWRHGACLVPAPRALVRTGMDLGPWLVDHEITVVSTVPTLASLWPADALDEVRLLIFGGEACPPELADRLAVDGREVWNTYGPTEATVVACAARLTPGEPVRIGLPLRGWDLAVVDGEGRVVETGADGELVIGGAGLARYLDRGKDAEKFAPIPSLGWARAYRSGDLVRAEADGLVFLGRADEQVKLGGRRIELGEVDSALQALRGVTAAAAAVKKTTAGADVLVGYVVPDAATSADPPADPDAEPEFDRAAALDRLREALPAALVPLLAVVDDLPTRTSGKVDRHALPWPLAATADTALAGTEGMLARLWADVLGVAPDTADADFFASGGGSLAAARLVSAVRETHPAVSVSDVYQHPTLAQFAALLDSRAAGPAHAPRDVRPTPRRAGVVQSLALLPMLTLVGARWAVALAAVVDVVGLVAPHAWLPAVSWWWVALGWLVLISPPGRIAIAAGGARVLLRGVAAGEHPRGGSVHVRLWAAERLAELSGATSLAGPWLAVYAKALGVRLGDDVDLHALPPVTGMLRVGRGAAIEPEVDLAGHWLDGDVLRLGAIRVGAHAVVGARSTLLPGSRVGKRAEIAPGSVVSGTARAGFRWAGVPATRAGKTGRPGARPARSRRFSVAYGVTSAGLSLLPVAAALPAVALLGAAVGIATSPAQALALALATVPVATLLFLATYAVLTMTAVRLLARGLVEGRHPVHSRVAWQAWTTERLMSAARVVLFPLYASLATPVWLRALGMRVGRGVEASTVLALPSLTTVGDGAFLADDTMVGSYELGGGWLRIGAARIGKRAFLGNSGMTAPGRAVPKRGLVGVLSSAPKRAKTGSSYVGMPPIELPRVAEAGDTSRTFDPPRRLVVARALVESARVLPVMASVALAVLVLAALQWLAVTVGPAVAVLASGGVLLAAGVVACALATAAKWLLVGRFRAVEKPLWSSFVWRTELADTFVEVVAVPWLAGSIGGTPLLNGWLRSMGARVGRGVWCETHWLPESDLVELGDGATVNRGCVVQTHLFHDRIMRMDQVTLSPGATMGPHGIVLPGATLGDTAIVGPGSLVMGGETVPGDSRWLGNPIAAWR